ncbi:T9SS type B sorting domain-containing protein [Flavobacterium laiguense]|uniref:Ig-like domain-containing protein n=1 Tax=Flavobacterium laiguense TaxID=2169409 RepID=A0A2U1K047_9FLAO|nr:T9SS type B sorting domain-containing protein [Flavobacterium laiguense]PWA10856.1 hypothetical protein DB891_03240 [Flavobacterium laiguense]
MKKIALLFFIFLSITSFAQSDCSDAIIVCGNTGFEGLTVTGIGTTQELTGLNTCKSQENNSLWLKLSINTGGTLGFLLVPGSNDINEDYDFFVFGPNASCNTLGQAIRCSTTNPLAINQNNNYTGMNENETDTSEGPGGAGNSFIKWLTVAAGDSYFLVIDRPIGSSNFSLQWTGTATFNTPPTFDVPTGISMDITQCDLDGTDDFSTAFDLTKNTPIIIGTQTDVTVTYHTQQNDALTSTNAIQNLTSFVNSINPQPLFARITNTITGCFNTSEFFIRTNANMSFPITKSSICDDATDGNDANGKAIFDLNKVTSDVFANQNTTSFTIKYYLTQNDANTNSNALSQFFHNTIPHQQSIYIKAYSSNLCVSTTKIDLIVNPLPQKTTAILVQCDTGLNPDGISLFNLSEANSIITNNDSNLSTSFFVNNADAVNNTNNLTTTFNNSINPQTIIVRVTNNTTGCYSFSSLQLKVNVIPEKTYFINPTCDDDGTEDGKHTFNLKDSNIPTTSTQKIIYYLNINDALLEQNAIVNPLSFFNETVYNQIIYARVEDGNDCFGISNIKLEVQKLPNIETASSAMVCSNLPSFFVQLDSGIQDGSPTSNYTYVWTKDGIILSGKTAPTLDVNTEGTYTVIVSTHSGCGKTRTITVTASDIAHIQNIDIIDLTNVNTVTINITGTGDYEYSLDEPLGPFQQSNFFDNVSSGIHDVYINDKNGCGTITKPIAVLGIPKFFTPNNDGYNDSWNIKEVNETFNKGARIFIYDRYGKVVKQVLPSSNGWDGTYTGNPMPADDYWYSIKLEDGREAKGHFLLKR